MKNIKWLQPSRARNESDSAISIGSAVNRGQRGHVQVAITIYTKTMQRLRWAVGDRVSIGWDDSMLYLRRTPTGTHQLCGTNTGKKKTKGQMETATISFFPGQPFPFPVLKDRQYLDTSDIIEDGAIIGFEYPRPSEVCDEILEFGRAARAGRQR